MVAVVCSMVFFFPIKGVFITQQSNTPGLCIKMHTAVQFTEYKTKLGKIHIDSEQL
jgi:hypothetical protein